MYRNLLRPFLSKRAGCLMSYQSYQFQHLRLFSTQTPPPNQEEEEFKQKMGQTYDNPYDVDKKAESSPAMKWLFVGVGCSLVLIMYYIEHIMKMPKQDLTKVIVLGEAQIGGPFSILNAEGKVVTENDFKGKYRIMYFGFVRCPDVCPTTLLKLAQVQEIIKKRRFFTVNSAKVQLEFMFISLDPESDSPKSVQDYADKFSTSIKGYLVPLDQKQQFCKLFKVYANKVPVEGGYTVDHTTYCYIMNKDGKFLDILPSNQGPEESIDIIERAIREDFKK